MSRWDDKYSSAILSLAKEIAKTNRIFYVDHPFTVKDFFKDRKTLSVKSRRAALLFGDNIFRKPYAEIENFVAVTPRLILPVNFLPPGEFYNSLSILNDAIVLSAVKRAIREFKIKKFILWNSFNPFFARDFFSELKPALKIYQSRDDISQQRYVARHGVYLEREAVKKADLVFTTSTELKRRLSQFSPHVYHLPNAADTELFRKAAGNNLDKPQELKNVKGKIVGYTGNISRSRVDFELLKNFAEANPDKTLLLVGPLDSDEHKKQGLDKMSNVIFTGSKKLHELPAYLSCMDCTIIPFKCNTLTKSIYPLKLNEYLAAGKPVVTSAFSEDLQEFKDVIYLARNPQEFLQMISIALQEDNPARKNERIKVAEKNTWTARVETFWKITGGYLNNKTIEKAVSTNSK